jgi:hypothetical protein
MLRVSPEGAVKVFADAPKTALNDVLGKNP